MDGAELLKADGIVVHGHRVASGRGGDPRFPEGTIAPQLPFLSAAVPGFDAHLGGLPFAGTINLRFPGRTVTVGRAETIVRDVAWTALFPPETFLLTRCRLVYDGRDVPAFLYVPDPATKPDHFQPHDAVELLARFVPGLAYGAAVRLLYPAAALAIG